MMTSTKIELRKFGAIQKPVAAIGQGTWNIERNDRMQAIAALRHGLDLGLTHIDTAEMYGDGEAEKIVAEVITGRRDEIFLVSKVLPQNASRLGTLEACARSLNRLKTDRLDCYLLHWEGSHPLEETIAAFEQLQTEGKILSWGVSNFDVPALESAQYIAGPGRMACNQILYHLGERSIEHRVMPWCREADVAVVAYSPFGQDRFPEPESASGHILKEIADHHQSTARQVALAFLLREKHVFVIPKAANPEHVEDNAAATSLQLTKDDINCLDAAFPRGKPRHGVPTL